MQNRTNVLNLRSGKSGDFGRVRNEENRGFQVGEQKSVQRSARESVRQGKQKRKRRKYIQGSDERGTEVLRDRRTAGGDRRSGRMQDPGQHGPDPGAGVSVGTVRDPDGGRADRGEQPAGSDHTAQTCSGGEQRTSLRECFVRVPCGCGRQGCPRHGENCGITHWLLKYKAGYAMMLRDISQKRDGETEGSA